MIHRAPVAQLSRLLEHDGPRGTVRRALAGVWERAASPVRPVTLPTDVRVIGVGGPTLGGSFKTPFVLALAIALSKRGMSVAVAVHGYLARARSPRLVRPHDDVSGVGDDALFLARELVEFGVPVVVGKPWSDVIAHAGSLSPTVIVDGLLQTAPERLAWSVMVLDASKPWGARWCPPAGDLRASPTALCRAADDLAEVTDSAAPFDGAPTTGGEAVERVSARTAFRVTSELTSVKGPDSEVMPIDLVARRRVGLLTAIARPGRVVAALALRGVHPVETRVFGDHRRLPEQRGYRARKDDLDLWVTTAKCATKLGPAYEGKPVWVLEHRLAVPREIVDRAVAASGPAR